MLSGLVTFPYNYLHFMKGSLLDIWNKKLISVSFFSIYFLVTFAKLFKFYNHSFWLAKMGLRISLPVLRVIQC